MHNFSLFIFYSKRVVEDVDPYKTISILHFAFLILHFFSGSSRTSTPTNEPLYKQKESKSTRKNPYILALFVIITLQECLKLCCRLCMRICHPHLVCLPVGKKQLLHCLPPRLLHTHLSKLEHPCRCRP